MNQVSQRPASSVPAGASIGASPSAHNTQQRYAEHPPPPRTSHEGLFAETYGQPAETTFPVVVGAANANHRRQRHHHDTARGPTHSCQPMSSHRDVVARTSGTRAGSTQSHRSVDAIAFQYYGRRRHQQPQQQQRNYEQNTQLDHPATSVKRQTVQMCDVSNGRGGSAPTTPGSRRQATPTNDRRNETPTCAQQQKRKPHDRLGTASGVAQRFRPVTTPPLPSTRRRTPTPVTDEVEETSTSLVSSTAPQRVAVREVVEVAGAAFSCLWPSPLTAPEQEKCDDLVQTLTQLPGSLAEEMLIAAARQYESHRLLHYYGGVYADKMAQYEAAEEAATPALAPPPPPAPSSSYNVQLDGRDGRSALLEALQRCMNALHHVDFTSQAGGFTRRRLQARERTEGSATAATTSKPAAGKAEPIRQSSQGRRSDTQGVASGVSSHQGQWSTSSGAKAPRQLRSRVMASRVSTTSRSRSCASRRGTPNATAATTTRRSPGQTNDFMQTIKPPHRHGLGGALPPTFTTSSPRKPIAEEGTAASEAKSAQNGGSGFGSSPQIPSKAHKACAYAEPHGTADDQVLSPLHPTTPTSKERVLPLSTDFVDALPTAYAGSVGTKLSPGAAAARRVYWEQQQQAQQCRLPQRFDSGEPLNSTQFEFLAGDRVSVNVVSRYPESASTDNIARRDAPPQRPEFESVSLDDSVLRSDVHSFQSAPVASQDIAASPPVTPAATTLTSSDTAAGNAPLPSPTHDVMVSLTEHLVPPATPQNLETIPVETSAGAASAADSEAFLEDASAVQAKQCKLTIAMESGVPLAEEDVWTTRVRTAPLEPADPTGRTGESSRDRSAPVTGSHSSLSLSDAV
jgi:hypothetical protein